MIVVGRDDNKHYGAAATRVPNGKNIEICADLGKRIAELSNKLHG
ncbi:MAG: hypothetical protein ACFFEF_19500 [Candidatus Thorarchaeota archaeon]